MKNSTKAIIIIISIIVITCTAIIVSVNRYNNIYPLTTKVVEIDRTNDIVTCEDFNGNQWQFEGCEDWFIDDICTMIMDTNGTEQIYDDTIVKIRYNGHLEGWK